MYINRLMENSIVRTLENFPVTAIIGPRQCGKSTLAKHILKTIGRDYIFIDLEKPSDSRKIENAEWFFTTQKDKIICIDEIQRSPGLFPCIRSLTDEYRRGFHKRADKLFALSKSKSLNLIKTFRPGYVFFE